MMTKSVFGRDIQNLFKNSTNVEIHVRPINLKVTKNPTSTIPFAFVLYLTYFLTIKLKYDFYFNTLSIFNDIF